MRLSLIPVVAISLWGASAADDAVAHQMRSGDTDVYHVRVLMRVVEGIAVP